MLHFVAGSRGARLSLQRAATLQHRIYERIDADIGAGMHEVETSHQLLWLHYMDALFYAARGERDLARNAVHACSLLDAQDAQLRALSAALADTRRTGPLDVRPFLIFDSAPVLTR